jgi:hypothetical protein
VKACVKVEARRSLQGHESRDGSSNFLEVQQQFQPYRKALANENHRDHGDLLSTNGMTGAGGRSALAAENLVSHVAFLLVSHLSRFLFFFSSRLSPSLSQIHQGSIHFLTQFSINHDVQNMFAIAVASLSDMHPSR